MTISAHTERSTKFVFQTVVSRLRTPVRLLPVIGLMAGLASAAPALADSSASSPGPLAISQLATGPATVGQPETFTITVTNTTASPATDVFLGDALPPGARLVGTLPNPNVCAKGGAGGVQAFACLVGTLAPGQSFPLTFTILSGGTNITNHAATTGFAGGSFVTNTSDLSLALLPGAQIPSPVGTATDVQVTGFASSGSATAGSQFGYVFQVKNNGPLVASAVSFSDALPAGETFIGAGNTVTGLCTNNAGTITCNLGDLAVGASALVGIAVGAPSGLPSGSVVADTGVVTSASLDSNLNNNAFTVNVKIL